MRVGIPFRAIQVNRVKDELELVFQYSNKFYRLPIHKAPYEFWKYRKLLLWLTEGKTVDEEITVKLSEEALIWIELDECEEISESYPL